jgi:hypothetical protein
VRLAMSSPLLLEHGQSTSSAYAALRNHTLETLQTKYYNSCADSGVVVVNHTSTSNSHDDNDKDASLSGVVSKRHFVKGQTVLSAPVLILPRGQEQLLFASSSQLSEQLRLYCFQTTTSLLCPSTMASQLVFEANTNTIKNQANQRNKSQPLCSDHDEAAGDGTCDDTPIPKIPISAANLKYVWSPWNDRNPQILMAGPIAEHKEDFIMGMTIDFVATVNIRPGDQLAIKDVTSLFRSAWDA